MRSKSPPCSSFWSFFGRDKQAKGKGRLATRLSRWRPAFEELEARVVLAASLQTDQLAYAPGAAALITASGFDAGETIDLWVLDADATFTGAEPPQSQIIDGGPGDLNGVADGIIQTSWPVPLGSSTSSFQVIATGRSSGETAQTSFQVTGSGAAGFGQLPLSFEPNLGQTDASVAFLARGPGYDLYLLPNEAVLTLVQSSAGGTSASDPQALDTASLASTAVIRMQLVGANADPQISGVGATEAVSNYFLGDDPANWLTGIVNYDQVEYVGIYPGIDAIFHGNPADLQYDFMVAAGADPSLIRLRYAGADQVNLDAQGNVVIHVGSAEVMTRAPVLYQVVDGVRQQVDGGYVLLGDNQVGFTIGAYDAALPLVIDPTLTYSTYLGGSGSDQSLSIAVDSAGAAYITGVTGSTNFPTTSPFQAANAGGNDIFVTKLNAAGTARVYSTYLGGSGDDRGFGIAVDSSGNAYLTGLTNSSTNFPRVSALQNTFGGGTWDSFVTKLNAAGSALVYSTFLGGSGDENASLLQTGGSGIAVDSSGRAWVTGMTTSTNLTGVNGFRGTHLADGGNRDAFVARINAGGSAYDYFSFLGGTGDDRGQAITVDASGNAYVTGATTSGTSVGAFTNFPTKTGAYQTTNRGGWDVFVSKINPSLSGTATLVYSTLIGSSGDDFGQGIGVDSSGNAYVTGIASGGAGTPFPTTAGALQAAPGSNFDAFVTKFNASGTALGYSTLLIGGSEERGQAIAVDAAGNATVTGITNSGNFPAVNPAQATLGNAMGHSGNWDAFVTRLNPSGAPYYSTYLGGSGDERGQGVALDSSGNAYVVGFSNSTNFPVASALQATNAGGYDVFLTKLTDTGNHAPVIRPIGTRSIVLGEALSFTPMVTDADLPAQTLTYSLDSFPGGASIDPNTGLFSWTPSSAGDYTVVVRVTDNGVGNLSSTQTFGIIVNATAPPAVTNPTALIGGNALQFDGNDFVEVADSPTLHSDRQITVSGWFKTDAFPRDWQNIFWKGNGGDIANQREYGLWINRAGFLYFSSTSSAQAGVAETVAASAAGIVQAGRWYHFAAVVNADEGYMRLFLDGEQVAQTAYSMSGIMNSTGSLKFGQAGTWDNYLNGSIDDIRIYDVARSQAAIRSDMYTPAQGDVDNLLAAWDFNTVTAGTIADVTGHGNTGGLGGSLAAIPTWQASDRTAEEARWAGENNTLDSRGGNNGTVVGTISYTTGEVGQALNLTGSGYVEIPSSGSLMPTALSIEAWVKPDFTSRPRVAYDYDVILLKQNPWDAPVAAGDGYALITSMDDTAVWPTGVGPDVTVPLGTPAFYITVGASGYVQLFSDTAIPDDGQFHHVAASYDGTTVRIYLDGVETGAHAITGTIRHATTNAFIGHDNTFPSLPSSLTAVDELSVYSRALTESEVQAIHAAGGAGKPALPALGGNVLTFDGVNDFGEVPDSAPLHSDRTQTVSGWFKTDAVTGQYQLIYFKGDPEPTTWAGGVNREHAIWINPSGGLHVISTPVGQTTQWGYDTPNFIQPNRWYHFANVIDADNGIMRTYIDGQQIQSGSYSSAGISTTTGPFRVGNTGSGGVYQFAGSLDDLRIYDTARTQSEIQSDMNQTVPGDSAGLIASWRFDEGSGATTADATGNGNTMNLGLSINNQSLPTSVASGAGLYATTPTPIIATVTNTADSGPGSLRQIITEVNLLAGDVPVTIRFNIPTTDPGYVDVDSALPGGDAGADAFVIQLLSALPAIAHANVTIDGRTQTTSGDTNPFGPEIVLDGRYVASGSGLQFNLSGNVVAGLSVQGFMSGNGLNFANGSSGNWVHGSYIGTDATGTESRGNGLNGILFSSGSGANLLGTNGDGVNDVAERNVVAGNGNYGVIFNGGPSVHSMAVVDRLIANTPATINPQLPNQTPALTFNATVTHADFNDLVSPAAGNWTVNNPIPGGGGDHYAVRGTGTLRVNTAGTYSFALAGDDGGRLRIDGVTVAAFEVGRSFAVSYGSVFLSAGTHTFEWVNFDGGGGAGFELSVAAGVNTSAVSAANGWRVLGDNTLPGNPIELQGTINVTAYYALANNVVAGNYVGTNAAGSAALANTFDGVIFFSTRGNRIGTNSDGVGDVDERNVLSGNAGRGLSIQGFGDSVIAGNYFGTNAAGDAAVGNGFDGILIYQGSSRNLVGANADGVRDDVERNVISANGNWGIRFNAAFTDNNVVQGNYLGTNAAGTGALGNVLDGIGFDAGPQFNRIGTDGNGSNDAAERNIISGNVRQGVRIDASNRNTIAGNYIGLDVNGTPLGNALEGVLILNTSYDNVVGGTAAQGNVIAYNRDAGVEVRGASTSNRITGNAIYGNTGIGIDLASDSVTRNDAGDGDLGPNGLLNAPVLTGARLDGSGNLVVTGYAPSATGYSSTVVRGVQGAIAGDSDTAIRLGDTNNDYVISENYNFPTSAFTVEYWMKSSDTTSAGTAFSYNTSELANNNEFLIFDYRNISIDLNGGPAAANSTGPTGVSANDGNWHHIAVTWQSSDGALKLYKDGNLAYSTTLNRGTQISPGGTLVLGQEQDSLGGSIDPAQRFIGSMDEVAIYSSALDISRIQAHYSAGASYSSAVTADSPVTYWRLGDAPGTVRPADLGSGASAPAVIELFLADGEANNFGEGQTYLATLVEGSAADTDAGTIAYNSPVVGADLANRFTFTIPLSSLPASVSAGMELTATATIGSTSEFSRNLNIKSTNAAPAIQSIAVAPQIDEGGVATLTVNYSDADALDGQIATIDWGDGTVQTVSYLGSAGLLSAPYTYGGHPYYVVKTNFSWYAAEANAQQMGGHLVSINDAAENDFIQFVLASEFNTPLQAAWIGANDNDFESVFRNPTGELAFLRFNAGNPDNGTGAGQDGGSFNFTNPGFWDDGTSQGARVSVVEIGPEKTFTVTHQYKDSGTPTVNVTLTDTDLSPLSDTDSATITVNNTAPRLVTGTTTTSTAIQKPSPVASDQFGSSMVIIGNTLYVGAPFDDTGAANAGAVYAFNATTGAYLGTVIQKNTGTAGYTRVANDQFGFSLAALGSKLLIGANLDDFGATNTGAVYLYDPATGNLTRIPNPFPATGSTTASPFADQFGISLAAVGSNFVVGANFADNGIITDAGAAYLFDGTTLQLLRTIRKPTLTVTDSGPNHADGYLSGPVGLGIVGNVASVTITNGGSGYTSAPTVTFTPPAIAGGTAATGTTIVVNGVVTGIAITNPGNGYSTAPLVSFTGGGGLGAAATATLGSALTNDSDTAYHFSGGTVVLGVPQLNITSGNANQNTVSFWMNWNGTNGAMPVGFNGYDLLFAATGGNPSFGFNTAFSEVYGIAHSGTVNGATNAGPIVISSTTNHGLTTGATVRIAGVLGNTAANGDWTVSVIDSLRFSLNGSTGNGAYTGGGTWTPLFGADQTPLLNNWHHVTAVFSNNNVSANQLWIDGVQQTLSQRFGNVSAVTIAAGGSGYTSVPTVTFGAPAPGGIQATGTAVLTGTAVTSVVITNPGSGYTAAPTVTFTGGGGTGATGTSTFVGGGFSTTRNVGAVLTSVNVTNGGSGYTSAPTVTIANGNVTFVSLNTIGSGYTSAPTVTFSGGGGTGAAATATVSGGVVTGITITNPGSGYTSVPNVTLSGGGGTGATAAAIINTGATATATVVGGVVTAITLTNIGSGYIGTPSVTITGGGGGGATASAVIATNARISGWSNVSQIATNRFFGAMDEVAFFNGALSGSQIQAQYSARSSGTYSATILGQNPAAYYRLGESAPANFVAAGLNDQLGWRVAALGNDKIVVSSPNDDGSAATGADLGALMIFDAATGALERTIYHPVPTRTGEVVFDRAIAVVGNYIVVGSPFADIDGGDTGLVYVYDVRPGRSCVRCRIPIRPRATTSASRWPLSVRTRSSSAHRSTIAAPPTPGRRSCSTLSPARCCASSRIRRPSRPIASATPWPPRPIASLSALRSTTPPPPMPARSTCIRPPMALRSRPRRSTRAAAPRCPALSTMPACSMPSTSPSTGATAPAPRWSTCPPCRRRPPRRCPGPTATAATRITPSRTPP